MTGALLLMPTPPGWTTGPVATWVTAAGWARALAEELGSARLITPSGGLTPDAAEALVARARTGSASSLRRFWTRARGAVPEEMHTARKDLRDLARGVRFLRHGAMSVKGLRLVWQHHELFQNAGLLLARRAKVPLVQFVDAPIVWEGARWGVRRPWARSLETLGERPQLMAADVVACVSEEVRGAAIARGAAPERTIVTPCAVDTDRFTRVSEAEVQRVRERHDIRPDSVVVGWLGSFRRFHGLELLIEALSTNDRHRRVTLLLVGDGQERKNLETLAKRLGVTNVRWAGLVSHEEVPAYVSAFDIAVVTAPAGEGFHYSPLKLKEYMAAARAIIAPAVGEMAELLDNGVDSVVTQPGDSRALAGALDTLIPDETLRCRIGAAAARKVAEVGTWRAQVGSALATLRARGWSV